ncbi:MAG: Fic family protein [Piscirickettsiaceae bacterium]|nr:Fic family protein [Piscirickettsiaceae bacterium]
MAKKEWIWQQTDWPNFEYQLEIILPELEILLRTIAPLELLASELGQDKQLNLESLILLDEALATAKIEGEILDRESVRSSIAKRLGIGDVKRTSRSAEAFVDVLLESVRSYANPLSDNMLFQWHSNMFYEKPILNTMLIGEYRNEVMQIVSGAFGKQKTHFEAPCDNQQCVADEINHFLSWFNTNYDGSLYIKAAIAKFWFVTIHPFDDGNGRLSRVIAERCLASAGDNGIRLYSISNEIEKNKNEYYALLEKSQRGTSLDLTDWIIWFLKQITSAAETSMKRLDKIRLTTYFWDKNRDVSFNPRQTKLISRLLETDDFKQGISRRKYKSLAHTTDITAARDLKDLLDKKVLEPIGEGRSRKYIIKGISKSS